MQSDPAPGSSLQSLPAAVTLLFTEPVTPAGAGIRVYSPTGKEVAESVEARGATLTAPLTSTETGTFVVTWQVFAADTHPSRGAFSFTVGAPTSNPFSTLVSSGEIGTATPLGLALQAAARWVHFAGFALVFGLGAYGLLGGAGGFSRGAGVVLLVVAEPIAVLGQLASLTFDGDTAIAVLGSGFGRLVALRLGAALLAWTVMATGRTWPLLAIGAVDAVLDGLGAHAIPGWPGVGQALVAVHVSAIGLWVGGLAGYLHAPNPRFPRYAAITFGVAAVTGGVLAFAHNATLMALVDTDYGRALLAKVILVGAALAAVLLRRRRVELGVAVAVIAAASLMAALPPSR